MDGYGRPTSDQLVASRSFRSRRHGEFIVGAFRRRKMDNSESHSVVAGVPG